jgi:hypothetical protein
MGYETTRTGIRNFTPDDDDDTMWIEAHYTGIDIETILVKAKAKWPDVTPEQISIQAEHVHTSYLGYDRYDPGDHTNYLRITRIK